MKILIIGARGAIGSAVVAALGANNDIITAGSQSGDVRMDIADDQSVSAAFSKIGKLDAVIVTAGKAAFKPLSELTTDDYLFGLQHKLLGQVRVVMFGLSHMYDGGSYTLTSGRTSRCPVFQGSAIAMVNGAIDAYVKAASIEMPRGIRINCVSPTLLDESVEQYGEYYPGWSTVPAQSVATAYVDSVVGARSGYVYEIDE